MKNIDFYKALEVVCLILAIGNIVLSWITGEHMPFYVSGIYALVGANYFRDNVKNKE